MIFHRNNYEDIKRYYNNTIIKLPEISGDRLWQILSIQPDEVKLVDVDGIEIYIDLNEEYEVDYPLPGRVVYQYADRAMLLTRRPAKMYYRGLHKENTALSSYGPGGSLGGFSWDIHTLQQFVDKPAYQDPITINPDEGESWAVNKHMAVCQSGHIMVLSKVIGKVEWESKQISVMASLFTPEIQAAFPTFTIR